MSDTMPVSAPTHPVLAAVAVCLAPYFSGPDDSAEVAQQRALNALGTTNAAGTHEILLTGCLFAASLGAMRAATQAIEPSLSVAQQLQFLGKACSLGRAAVQIEASLIKGASGETASSKATSSRTRCVEVTQQSTALPESQPAPRPIQEHSQPTPATPPPRDLAASPWLRPGPPGLPFAPFRSPDANDALQALIDEVMAEDHNGLSPAATSLPGTPLPAAPALGTPALGTPAPGTPRRQGEAPPVHSTRLPSHLRPMPTDSRPSSFRDALLCSSAMPPGMSAG